LADSRPSQKHHHRRRLTLSLAEKRPTRKESHRLRPSGQEGLYIQYLLKATGQKFINLAREIRVSPRFIPLVVFGHRRSARIESEIAKILGHSSWNDVVLEARSEIQKKPVEVIVREMKQKHDAKTKAVKENMAAHIAEGVKRMSEKETRRRA